MLQRRSSGLLQRNDGGGRSSISSSSGSIRKRSLRVGAKVTRSEVSIDVDRSMGETNVGNGKTENESGRCVRRMSFSVGDVSLRGRRVDAADEEAEAADKRRDNASERDDTCSAPWGPPAVTGANASSATTGSVSNVQGLAVVVPVSSGTNAAASPTIASATRETTANPGRALGASSVSIHARRSTELARTRPPSVEGNVDDDEENLSSASNSCPIVPGGMGGQHEAAPDIVGGQGVGRGGTNRAGTSGEREIHAKEKTAATKIGNVLAALPLSKLKIVIGTRD